MKVIKYKSKKTYKTKDGKEFHYTNWILELDNGKQVAVRCVNNDDYKILDAVCEYHG